MRTDLKIGLGLVWASLAVALVWLPPPALADGTQTGLLMGRVTDGAGLPLPQVEVRVSGPQTQRVALSGVEGYFRFPGLEVGNYSIEAELLGLQTSRPVRVFLDTTTTIQIILSEDESASLTGPAASELIEVEAIAPLVDPFRTQVGATVNRDFLDELPVTRFYQSVALLLPGVVGGEDGNPNVSGSLREGNLYLIDGVDTTDATTGLFGLNLNYEAIEEVAVTTAAPASLYGRFSGALINVVTQSGTDDFRGTARWLTTNAGWNSDYENNFASVAGDAVTANSTDGGLKSTWAATLAGPLAKERLWFFGAFESGGTTDRLQPTLGGDTWNDGTDLEGSLLKVTWQPTDTHTIVAQRTADSASFAAFAALDRSAGENQTDVKGQPAADTFVERPGDVFALEDRSQEGQFTTIQWFGAPTQNLSLSAAAALQDRRLRRDPLNRRGLTADAPHIGFELEEINEDGAFFLGTVYNGLFDVGLEERERRQLDLNGNWFVRWHGADHELRFGVDFQQTDSLRLFNVSGQPGIDPLTGRPVSGQAFDDLDFSAACLQRAECQNGFDPATGQFVPAFFRNFWTREPTETEMENVAIYFEDAIILGRWLITVGARFDTTQGELRSGEKLLDHDAIAPRFGFKYDPRGEGKEYLFATYSEFYEPFDQRFIDSFLSDEIASGFTEYVWLGLLGEDCSGEDPADLASRCWFPTFSEDFLRFRFDNELSPDLQRASVEEFVAGFERQLTRTTAVRLAYVDRTWNDLWDDVFRLTDPTDPFSDFTATVENLPSARRTYRGLQLLLQKRFANRWQLLGSYTWSEALGNLFLNDGVSSFGDFPEANDAGTTNRFGPAPYDSPTQIKIFSNYQQPIGRSNLSLGTVLRFAEGTPYQEEAFEGFLGTRFRTPRGALRFDDFFQWDVSAALTVPLVDEMETRLKLEIFNLTDEQTQLAAETLIDLENFGEPRTLADIQNPRHIRLSLGIHF